MLLYTNNENLKRQRYLLIAGIIASLTCTVGCDAKESAEEDTARTAACIEYMRAYCERYHECVRNEPSVIECMMRNAIDCPDVMFAEGSRHTVESVLHCAEQWPSMLCRAVQRRDKPDCALTGTRSEGEPCISPMQCTSGKCSQTNMRICGVCTSNDLRGEGTHCSGKTEWCDQAYICDRNIETCVARLGIGDECEPGTAYNRCVPHDCVYDSSSSSFRCTPYPTVGEDCSKTKSCAYNDAYCDISGKCLAFPGSGQNCGVHAFTKVPSYCASGNYCDMSVDPPVCRLLPTTGEPCLETPDGSLFCDDESECDSDAIPPTCRALPGAGESCEESPCAGQLFCDCGLELCTKGVCVRVRFPGQSCTDPYDRCLDYASTCRDGVCVPVESQYLSEERCQ